MENNRGFGWPWRNRGTEPDKKDNKSISIENSLKGIQSGFNELLKRQLEHTYDDAWNTQQATIDCLQDENEKLKNKLEQSKKEKEDASSRFRGLCYENENLKEQLEQSKKENEEATSLQNIYKYESEQLKKEGSFLKFVLKGLHPQICTLISTIENLENKSSEDNSNKEVVGVLRGFYLSLCQTISNYKAEVLITDVGKPFDEKRHHRMETIPTNKKEEDNTISESLVPGIEFDSEVKIKEEVNVFKYMSDDPEELNETNETDDIVEMMPEPEQPHDEQPIPPELWYSVDDKSLFDIRFDSENRCRISLGKARWISFSRMDINDKVTKFNTTAIPYKEGEDREKGIDLFWNGTMLFYEVFYIDDNSPILSGKINV